MAATVRLFNSVRRMLGVRRKRAIPSPGPRPRLGAKIVRDDLRITVQAGLTDSTWRWLIECGWREETYRGDRRAYREIPPSLVASLFDASEPTELAELLEHAIGDAEFRPVVMLPLRRH